MKSDAVRHTEKSQWKWLAGVATVAVLLAGCGADSSDATGGNPQSTNTVTGNENEWKIVADHKDIKAGDVTFTFTNKGTISHELLVIRTDLPLGKIALASDGRFNEEDPKTINVGETGEVLVGATNTFNVKLAPGKYQLVCNLKDHYRNGMYVTFTVD